MCVVLLTPTSKTCVWRPIPHVNQISWTLDLTSRMRHTRKARLSHESWSAAKLQLIMLSACQASTEFSGDFFFLKDVPSRDVARVFCWDCCIWNRCQRKENFQLHSFLSRSSMKVAPDAERWKTSQTLWMRSNEVHRGTVVIICRTKYRPMFLSIPQHFFTLRCKVCRNNLEQIFTNSNAGVAFIRTRRSGLAGPRNKQNLAFCANIVSSNILQRPSSSWELRAFLKSSLLAILRLELLPFSPKIPEPEPPLCVYPRNMRCGNKWPWPLPLILHQLPVYLNNSNMLWKKGDMSSAESCDFSGSDHPNMGLRNYHRMIKTHSLHHVNWWVFWNECSPETCTARFLFLAPCNHAALYDVNNHQLWGHSAWSALLFADMHADDKLV